MTGTSHSTELNLATSASGSTPLTMSSQEIADLVGKRHDNVKRTMENLSNSGLIRFTQSEETSHEGAGARPVEVYNVGKRDSYVVVARLSPEFTARLVDRWMELERVQPPAQPVIDPSDPKVMLAVFGHLQKQVAEKDEIIAAQGVQVKALERLESAEGSMCLTDAAKTLGVGRDALIARMQAERWIFKRTGSKNWLAYDDKRRAGYMEHDDHLYLDSQKRERVSTRALVTAKGLVRLAEILSRPLH